VSRRALVTGITGQDGSFLAEQLLARGDEVIGLTRRDPAADHGAVEPLRGRITVVRGEAGDPATLATIGEAAPDEIYHLAAPTFVPDSWERPAATMAAIHGSAAALLALVAGELPATRLFVAGSAEMFGDERRPARFVTRKITRGAAEIALGRRERLQLGDLSAVRDWSFAGDVMRGAMLALGHDEPDDYVLASGVGHTVRDLLDAAFAHVGLDPDAHVDIDPTLVRAPERVAPVGDPSRARDVLGWEPTLDFAGLVGRMVDADLAALSD
jgi:GDPmannose 4,6-dehydratase